VRHGASRHGGGAVRILHVVPTYLPATRYGGPIHSVHGLARAQAALGHEVHVATTSVDGPSDSPVPLGHPVDLDRVSVWYFRSPALRRLYWAPSMARYYSRQMPAFDVCHLHSVFLWPTNRAARSAARAGVPYVVSPRGMLDPDLIRQRSRLLKTAWIQLVEKWTIEHAAVVHFTSRLELQACDALGLRPRSTSVIPNGFDAGDVQASASPSAAAPYVLYLGRVTWKKGIDRLIRAMASLPDLRLVVAGNDEESLTPALQALASELGIGDRVTFPGAVAGAAKWDLLRAARCMVLPSRSENFGNVVLEALAAGCPVVITKNVGIAEYLDDAAAVTAPDPEALAEAIARLHGDCEHRERQRESGREKLLQFTWETVAKRMVEAYGDAATGSRAA